jgi:hypothetical protein
VFPSRIGSIQTGLQLRRPASADDAHGIFLALGVHNQNHSSIERADGDEPIFLVGMRFVEDLQPSPRVNRTLASWNERPCFR